MSRTTRLRGSFAGLGIISAGLALILLMAAPAQAATLSQSQASAINVSALNIPFLPQARAANDGSSPTVTDSSEGRIPLLPGVSAANVGLFAQTARANDNGTSAACAGILGNGGALSLGSDGTCVGGSTAGPAIINLPSFTIAGTGFSFRLEASALYSSCTAGPSDSSTGFSAESTLANVTLIARATVLGVGPTIRIPINLNGSISIPPPFSAVVSLDVNRVVRTGPRTSATALQIGLGPNSSIFSAGFGQTVCGQNAVTADVPGLPLSPAGLATAAGSAAVLGSVYAGRKLSKRSTTAA